MMLKFLGGRATFIQRATSILDSRVYLGVIILQLSEGLGLNTRGVADKSIS